MGHCRCCSVVVVVVVLKVKAHSLGFPCSTTTAFTFCICWRTAPFLQAPGMIWWSSPSRSVSWFCSPGYRIRIILCRQSHALEIILTVSCSCCMVVRRQLQRWASIPKAFSTILRPRESRYFKIRSSTVMFLCPKGFIVQVRTANASSPMKKYGMSRSSLGSGSAGGNPMSPVSRDALRAEALKIPLSEEEPLLPMSAHRNLYCESTRPNSTMEKKPL